jgi:hypothetical protein
VIELPRFWRTGFQEPGTAWMPCGSVRRPEPQGSADRPEEVQPAREAALGACAPTLPLHEAPEQERDQTEERRHPDLLGRPVRRGAHGQVVDICAWSDDGRGAAWPSRGPNDLLVS